MTKDEAVSMTKILIDEATVKLALDVLDRTGTDYGSKQWEYENEAITALREALEQPAQQVTDGQVEAALKAACMHSTAESRKDMRRAIEAATQPAQQEPVGMYRNKCTCKHFPLTDEEIKMMIPDGGAWKYEVGFTEAIAFARAIEAAHGITGEQK